MQQKLKRRDATLSRRLSLSLGWCHVSYKRRGSILTFRFVSRALLGQGVQGTSFTRIHSLVVYFHFRLQVLTFLPESPRILTLVRRFLLLLGTLMASSSSFTTSTRTLRTMLTKEVTPLGEVSSFDQTKTLYDEGEPTEDTSSPAPESRHLPSVSTAIPEASTNPRKRKKPNPNPSNPGPSNVPRNTKRNRCPPITNPEYSWVSGEVAKHAS